MVHQPEDEGAEHRSDEEDRPGVRVAGEEKRSADQGRDDDDPRDVHHLERGQFDLQDRVRGSVEGRDAVPFDALLLATGAEPVHLNLPGEDTGPVHYLRSLADSRRIVESAKQAERAVVIGGSFIGLETAASLRARGLEVHVVAPEAVPLERVMGHELGDFIRALHEEKGVHFHLGRKPGRVERDAGSTGPVERHRSGARGGGGGEGALRGELVSWIVGWLDG